MSTDDDARDGKDLTAPADRSALDKVRERLLSPVDATVDLTLAALWHRAEKTVAAKRRLNPSADAEAIVAMIVKDFERDTAVMGAASGAATASPGRYAQTRKVGGMLIGSAALFHRSAHMVLAVAHAYGHDLSEVEDRRAAVSGILSMYVGANESATRVTDAAASGIADKAVRKLPNKHISTVNQKVFEKQVFIKRPGVVPGKIPLSTVSHGGLGILFGGVKNYALARALAALAVKEFRPTDEPEPLPSPEEPDAAT